MTMNIIIYNIGCMQLKFYHKKTHITFDSISMRWIMPISPLQYVLGYHYNQVTKKLLTNNTTLITKTLSFFPSCIMELANVKLMVILFLCLFTNNDLWWKLVTEWDSILQLHKVMFCWPLWHIPSLLCLEAQVETRKIFIFRLY